MAIWTLRILSLLRIVAALLIALFAARHFGRFHGGNAPARP